MNIDQKIKYFQKNKCKTLKGLAEKFEKAAKEGKLKKV